MPFPEDDIRYAKLCLVALSLQQKKMHVAGNHLLSHLWGDAKYEKGLANRYNYFLALEELLELQATTCIQYIHLGMHDLTNLNFMMQKSYDKVFQQFVDNAADELENMKREFHWPCSSPDGKYTEKDIKDFTQFRKKVWQDNLPSEFLNKKEVAAFVETAKTKMNVVATDLENIHGKLSQIRATFEDEMERFDKFSHNRSATNSILLGRKNFTRSQAQLLIAEAFSKASEPVLVKSTDLDGEGLSLSYHLLVAVNNANTLQEAKELLTWGLEWYFYQNGQAHFFEYQDAFGNNKLITDRKGYTVLDKMFCSPWEREIIAIMFTFGIRLSETSINHTLLSKNKSLLHYLVDNLHFDLLSHLRSQHPINWLLADDDGNTLLDCIIEKFEKNKSELLFLENLKHVRSLRNGDRVAPLFAMLENFRAWYEELHNKAPFPRENNIKLSTAELATSLLVNNAKIENRQIQTQNFLYQFFQRLFYESAPSRENIFTLELVLFSSTMCKCDVQLFDALKKQLGQSTWSQEFKTQIRDIISLMEKNATFTHPNFHVTKSARDHLVQNNKLEQNAQFKHKQLNIVTAYVAGQESVRQEAEREKNEKEKERAEKIKEREAKEQALAQSERDKSQIEALLRKIAVMEAQMTPPTSTPNSTLMTEFGLHAHSPPRTTSSTSSTSSTVEVQRTFGFNVQE